MFYVCMYPGAAAGLLPSRFRFRFRVLDAGPGSGEDEGGSDAFTETVALVNVLLPLITI